MTRARPQWVQFSHTLGPGIAIVILIAIGVYSWLDGEAYRTAALGADQARISVQLLEKLTSLLTDAESGQRGYLLTGDLVYLTPYHRAVAAIESVQAEMRRSGTADPEHEHRLDQLVAAKLAEMARSIELRRRGGEKEAVAMVRTDQGRSAMDQIRALAAHDAAGENAKYRALTASAARHGYKTRVLILAGAILLALLLWLTSRQVNHLLTAQRALIGDLDRSREQEARGKAALDTMLRSIGEGVIATDTSGRIRFINGVAEQLTGWRSGEAEELPLQDVLQLVDEHTRVPAPDLSQRVLQEGLIRATGGTSLLLARDGRETPVEYSGAPVQDGQNAPSGVAIVFRDVTEQRRLASQLRQSQKLEAVGQLAGGIAHDFNNLLTVIEGYAEMLRGSAPEDSEQADSAQEILLSAQRAASLTRQLLAFSRRQVLQPIRLNLNHNVVSTQRMLARLLGENIEVVMKPAPGLPDVMADPGQIDQIIINLAVNARDAMPHGGRLSIETGILELDAPDSARYPGMPPATYVRLSLHDTGHGMDERTRLRIFEPFFTTKEIGRGTGLGLSTVYGIVKQSGGHIQVESEPGMGATFDIFLPAAPPAPRAATQSEPRATIHVPSETILVVEDDAGVQKLVAAMLTGLGYRVLAPATPDEALKLCEDPQRAIDLLVTDMVLPETDGIAVAQKATTLRPRLKVLFMSGYTEHPLLQQPGVESTAFLHKPFTKQKLAAKVREALGVE
jgi:two-component system cell cycle sensor histidine kinase/response regulator CckA